MSSSIAPSRSSESGSAIVSGLVAVPNWTSVSRPSVSGCPAAQVDVRRPAAGYASGTTAASLKWPSSPVRTVACR